MHQRPPADPYNKDDLLVTSTATTQVTMAQPEQQRQVYDLVSGIDGADGYHGVTEEEPSDDSGAEDREGLETTRQQTDLFDDVFGGGDDTFEHTSSRPAAPDAMAHARTATDTSAHPSDMNRLQQEHSTAGYRDGLTAGKNASLQAGFDEGYSLGAALGLVVGELLGLIEGLLGFQVDGDSPGADEGALLARARQELAMQSIYSPTYFAPDGTWVYDVATGDESETIFDVAHAHPLVRSWRETVDKELTRRRVRWAKPGEEAELAAVLGLTEDEPEKEPKKVTASSSTAAAASPSEPAARAPPSNTSALDW
ncbi:abc1 domain containing protein [Ophiostoma piceae UAMH 11346]|uniref:Protein YAE1 n=1 Tax=Ophiostoma piceae (strain UAMH 11346) TaxID=1262450 RepID=S3CFA8_OPHP1|nr:abc1 domain containing protein [Ophiostoma piceae UAMH 11346]